MSDRSIQSRLLPSTNEEEAIDRSRPEHVAYSAIRGLQAGFVATLIMTAFRLPILRSLPPSANFWARYVGDDDADEYAGIGLLLHLLYGTSAGAVFGGLFAFWDAERSIEAEQRGLVWGSVYGMALSAFGSQFMLKELLEIELEADELALFHAGHLVYGLALGAWVGSRTEGVGDPEEDYDYGEEN
ncbi:hypothetical protein OB955_07610 [Halobacteria archaeon AArc-m2/3/4]|uniref:DUF1440 domain-containing protein n=1 Tax=Natronoglomus mannanivorans TaxID=2979990 RepID=A0ABT2QCH0_9EURY|nr:hypothetical protein [Halobacteria archaeon AArc-m2/3/4]